MSDKKIEKHIKQLNQFRPHLMKIFTALVFLFTLLVYGTIALVLWILGQSGIEDYFSLIIYSLLGLLFVTVALMWLVIFGVYTRVIFPVYRVFVIFNTILKYEVTNFTTSENIKMLQTFIRQTLNNLNQSTVAYHKVFNEAEEYIEKVNTLSERNAALEKSRSELSELVDELERNQSQLSLEKAKTESIINSIPDAIVASSRDGNIFMINKAAEQMFEIPSEELMGKFLDTIYPLTELKRNPQYDIVPTQEALKGKIETQEFDFRMIQSKTTISVQNVASPIYLKGEIIGAIDVFRDITREKEVDRAQKEFVSLASHQLRTPITSINWNAEILVSDLEAQGELQEYAQEILRENRRMQRLVNALLNLSRIDLGSVKFVLDTIQVKEFIDNLVQSLNIEMEQHGTQVVVNIDEDLTIVNDPVHIDVIFTNLISNAIKYTPEQNGEVEVTAWQTYGNTVLFKVQDNGLGIPQDEQSQIFSRLFRAHNAKETDTDGNGLGLYIVKQLVDTMEGEIWFESKKNQGTKFFLSVPRKIDLESNEESMIQ